LGGKGFQNTAISKGLGEKSYIYGEKRMRGKATDQTGLFPRFVEKGEC